MKLFFFAFNLIAFYMNAFTQSKENGFRIFICNEYKDDSLYQKTINLGFNSYYPILTYPVQEIKLERERPITSLTVFNNNIQIDGVSLMVQPGDTIYTQVISSDKPLAYSDINSKEKFYADYLKKKNSQQAFQQLSDLLNQKPFNYKEYQKNLFSYYSGETLFTEKYYAGKPFLKESLLNMIQNQQFISFILPFLYGYISASSFIGNEDSIIKFNYERLSHFQQGYNENVTFRRALSNLNAYFAKITLSNVLLPNDYVSLYRSAKKNFPKDLSLFLIAIYHNSITKLGDPKYTRISNLLYSELKNANFDVRSKVIIDSMHRRQFLLNTNLKDFEKDILVDTSGHRFELKGLLNSGQPVLLDFWATYCAPCIEQIPYLDMIKAKYDSLNVITISVDKDAVKWKNFVLQKGAKNAPSYLIAYPSSAKILKTYSVKDIPRYILFDKNGKCLNVDFSLPSDKNFMEELKKAIK